MITLFTNDLCVCYLEKYRMTHEYMSLYLFAVVVDV